jgi:hypothetical protein
VQYELVNVSGANVHVAQFPGPSVIATCETEHGGVGGAAGGAWSKDGTLARKYYLQLAPGEALMGEAIATVAPECRRNLQALGVFQMEDSNDWGLAIPGRRIAANPLPVAIESRPRDSANSRADSSESTARSPVTLAACAKGDEVVLHMTPRELPLLVTTSPARSKPDNGVASPAGAWAIAPAESRRHPAMVVWRGRSRTSLHLTATTVPAGRPIEATWLSADVVCVQANLNPMATAAWLVDVRQTRVLAAASLQAPPPSPPPARNPQRDY